MNRIVSLQKKAIRVIADEEYCAHSKPLFIRLKILPISVMLPHIIVSLFTAKTTFRTNFLIRISALKERVPAANTRQLEKWCLPKTRTNYGQQMLKYIIPYTLNNNTTLIDGPAINKRALIEYFLNSIA